MKKFLAALTSFCMIFALLPVTAFSTEIPTTVNTPLGISTVTYEDKIVYANGVPIVIKADGDKTYVYDSTGTTVLAKDASGNPLDVKGLAVCGGSSAQEVASTSVTMESGTVKSLYGGGMNGSVSGNASVTIHGGTATALVAGGGVKAPVGSVAVEITKMDAKLPIFVGASADGVVEGDITLNLANCGIGQFFAGNHTTGKASPNGVGGDLTVVLDNVIVTGSLTSSGNSGDIAGTATYRLIGSTEVLSGCKFYPARSLNPATDGTTPKGVVKGRVEVYLLSSYAGQPVDRAGSDDVHVYIDGQETDGNGGAEPTTPTSVTFEDSKVFANGVPIVIKEGTDGKTYIYDATGQTILLRDANNADLALDPLVAVFGGSRVEGDEPTASTSVTMESGAVGTIYGGGREASVTGDSTVTVTGGTIKALLGGGCSTADVGGNVTVTVSGLTTPLPTFVGAGYNGRTEGNVTLTITDVEIATLFAGNQGKGAEPVPNGVGGNLTVTLDSATIGEMYSSGNKGDIAGTATYTFLNGATVTGLFTPARSKNPPTLTSAPLGTVKGLVKVYLPAGYDHTMVNRTGSTHVRVYVDGVEAGVIAITEDGGNVFANGRPIVIKLDTADGKTYLYDSNEEEKIFAKPVDTLTVYGGSSTTNVERASVLFQSGTVKGLVAGGSNSCTADKATLEVAVGTTKTSIDVAGISGSAVVSLPAGYTLADVKNLTSGIRLFIDGVEQSAAVAAPDHVTRNGSEYFANGIPIVVDQDTDGKTYIYDAAGQTKLLSEAVEGTKPAIYGGSEAKGSSVPSTSVTMRGGSVYYIYGGGKYGSVTGSSALTIVGGLVDSTACSGGYDADVYGDVSLNITGLTVAKSVGAGNYGRIHGNSTITISGSRVKSIYGGTRGTSRGTGYPSPDVMGNVSIHLYDWEGETVIGGCGGGSVLGNVEMELVGVVATNAGIVPLDKVDLDGNPSVKGTAVVRVSDDVNRDTILPKNDPRITIEAITSVTVGEIAAPTYRTNDNVLDTAGDAGKLVMRLIELPSAEGSTARTGDALYISFPNGENMLVDAGSTVVAPYVTDALHKMGVTRLDRVVGTHYHIDHIGGMPAVMNQFEVGKLYKMNTTLTATCFTDMMNVVEAKSIPTEDLSRGDSFSIGDVLVEVLGPKLDSDGMVALLGAAGDEQFNNTSIILKLTYGGQSALLTGDLYMLGENELVKAYRDTPEKLNADFLKVPHHGDTTSSSQSFVNAISPSVVGISNFRNSDTIMSRYISSGAAAYHNRNDGTIKLTMNGKTARDILVETEKTAVAQSADAELSIASAILEKGGDKALTFALTCKNGTNFVGVSKHRQLLDSQYVTSVTAPDGTVQVTISGAYLKGLSAGIHNLGVHYSAAGNPGLPLTIVVQAAAGTVLPDPDPDPAPDYDPDPNPPSAPPVNTVETTKKLEEAINAVKDLSAITLDKLPAGVTITTTAAGTSIATVPIKMSSGNATVNMDIINTLANGSAKVGIEFTVSSGTTGSSVSILMPGGFGAVTEPGRLSYSLDYKEKAPDADVMLQAVKSAGAASVTAQVGGNFRLPVAATVTISVQLPEGKTINIFKYDPDTGKFITVGKAVVKGGKLTFATRDFGQLIFTDGVV